ncbi:MAG: adenosine kinase [Methylobacteriaceae bacterium]|nr:adenosine kinase [Methylobacteriaceae bacterium]
MTEIRYDVLGLGNSLVDIIARVDDDFLIRSQVRKGGMTLIDEPRAESLYGSMGPATIISGGSAANTIVGVASFGLAAAYIGKVKADTLGRAFIHDIRAMGVGFDTVPAAEGPATGRCYILVTPDGERSMSTYLGASQNLAPADVEEALVRQSAIVYLEGYMWDPPAAKEAFVKASKIAHAAGRRVALTLSDPFCVDRYRAEFLALMRSRTVDIVFANQHELKSLYQTADLETALEAVRSDAALGIVTRSAEGCLVVTREETCAVAAFPVEHVADTTGAGDLFAAGFLAGLARGADAATCARLGALAAAEVIQHLGARPQVGLAHLAADNGLAL